MSREIKFRVRDAGTGEFICYEEIKDGQWSSWWTEGELYLKENRHIGIMRTQFNAIREQFTGLTDKNGVEIYENDIVELQWKHKTWVEPVVFDCGGFYPFTDTCGQYADPWEVSALVHDNYEVIGNIHEHKHLLED